MRRATRSHRNNLATGLGLAVGVLGFAWPGGVNIFMVFGGLLLFATGILDSKEMDKEVLDGERPEEQDH